MKTKKETEKIDTLHWCDDTYFEVSFLKSSWLNYRKRVRLGRLMIYHQADIQFQKGN